MSQAFDRVDRTKLCEALCRTGMPAELINTIVHWRNTIQYHLQVADLKETIHCGRGLRQGCTLSPTLWVAITSHVLHMLGQTVTEEWIRDQLTLFADDVLGQWSFNSEQDLTFMLQCMDAIFSVLEAFGMKVNDQKSSLIIQVKGRVATDWLKARTRTVKGVKTFVTATPQGRILYIPIVQQIKYLGIMLSYHNPAKHTVAYRLRQAEAQRRRLQKVLQGKHILSIKQRVQLWKACVWTSLQHGLNAVGVGCARQLRALSSSPVHIAHESTEALFRRLGFEEPHLLLGKRMNTLSTTLANSRDPMMHTTKLINTVQQNQWQLEKAVRHWQNIKARQKFEDSPDNGSLLLPREGGMWLQPVVTSKGVLPAQFMCPQCLLFFVDMRMLKKHHVDSHGTPLEPLLRNFDRFLHSQDDMPTCRRCEHEFQTWQALQGHILGNHCSAFWLKCQDPQQETEDTSSPGQPTLEQGKMNERIFSTSTGPVMCHDDLRSFLGTHGWPAIVQLRSICMHLRSHCAICDQWTHPWKLKLHYRGSHSTIWQDYGIMVDSDCSLIRRQAVTPCRFCGAQVRHAVAHTSKCPTVWQVCLLTRMWNDDRAMRPLDLQRNRSNVLRLARERQSRHSKAHKQKRLAANEPLLSQTVSTDFFPPTSEVEQARTPSHDWMQPLEHISWCERARHQCIQCKVPTADVRDFMQHCTSAHEGFWQHRTDYVQDSILLNQATTLCCWCRATTHRPTLHAQYCIPVMNAALLRYETVSRFSRMDTTPMDELKSMYGEMLPSLSSTTCTPETTPTRSTGKRSASPDAPERSQNAGPEKHKGQRQGTRSTAPEDVSNPRELQPHGRHVPPGKGHGQGVGPPVAEARAAIDAIGPGHCLAVHVPEQARREGEHPAGIVQDKPGLEAKNGERNQADNVLEGYGDAVHLCGAPRPGQEGDYHGGVQSSGDPTAVDDTGGTLEFSALECRDGAAGQDRGPGHHAGGVGTVDRDHPTELRADRCPIQVSGDPKAGCRTCGPPTDLCRGGGTEAARSADFIPIPRQDPGGGGVAASGSTSSSPSTPDVATGRHAQPLSQMVTALALRNPTNLCYLNSVVSVWLWLAAKTTGESNKLFGRASEAFQRILASSSASPYIAGMLAWRQILLTWPQLHQQNDAHEFWIYLQDFAKAPVFEGVWEARTAVEGPRRYIRELQGTLSTGVTVPLPQRTTDLDSCIAAWCRQPFTHALVQAPLWLCIHLPRYVEQAGRIYKNKVCVRIDPGNVTYVPIFCRNGTTVQWMPYRILAGITHAGRDTKSGHYRAFLSDAPLSPNIWFTDDGQPAKSCTDDLLHHIHHECYMCFLARV